MEKLIKNGNSRPIRRSQTPWTPLEIAHHEANNVQRMRRALESIDGWETMGATKLAQELCDIGTNPPIGTSKIVSVYF